MRNDTYKRVYEFIIEYMIKHNYPPSIREICAGVGLSSSSSVFSQLKTLKSMGKINMVDNQPRTITVPGIIYIDCRK